MTTYTHDTSTIKVVERGDINGLQIGATTDDILNAFFEQAEVSPESVTEVEIVPGGLPRTCYLHVNPAQPWFADVSSYGGELGVVLHDYLTEEANDER